MKARRTLATAALVLAVVLVTDALLAQVGKRVIPEWARVERERAIRQLHPIYDHDLVANQDTFHQFANGAVVPFFTNSLGMRDSRVRDVPLKPTRPRVLLIGDSFTEGAGYGFEDTFAGHITAALDKRGIEVLNAGAASYAPSLYHLKVKNLLETRKLEINSLVVFIDISDPYDEVACYEIQNGRAVANHCDPRRMKPVKMFLADNSVIYRTYRLLKDGRKHSHREERGHLAAVTGLPRSNWTYDDGARKAIGAPGLAKSARALDALKILLDKRGIPLTVVVYPWPDQIKNDTVDSLQVTYWRNWTRENGAGFVNAFPPFYRQPPEQVIDDLFTPFDPHYNPKGHALVADTFLEKFDTKTLKAR